MNEQALTVREAIIGRRSIKKFNGQPVDRADLLQIIDDAVWAPNHQNREPWRLVVACGKELFQLHDLLRNTTIPDWRTLSEEEVEKRMQKFTTPGGYVFVIVPEDPRQKERLEDFAAACALIQNMMLLAWDYGIGSCWKTPEFLDKPDFRKALGVKPGERIVGMVQFGYFDELPKGKDRKKSDEIVTIFGENEEEHKEE
ncbi:MULTISPECIES: nitroreductase family protein [Ureibacillus]|jgi:nitroreductase|uniref:Putative NAD(P)H nitroreductase n=1 Tax=Ureibacillus thermosphaericus TaxID=51173 RepID=A0A840PYS7_URETH|nr:nitroreductase [Ureibacillus thermosphaericus]MBB5148006.1 nitroreductase [Ureibacillus thermosphaericus]NKZ30717.1 nitroreductase [Ureibacillus thermosphaericus]